MLQVLSICYALIFFFLEGGVHKRIRKRKLCQGITIVLCSLHLLLNSNRRLDGNHRKKRRKQKGEKDRRENSCPLPQSWPFLLFLINQPAFSHPNQNATPFHTLKRVTASGLNKSLYKARPMSLSLRPPLQHLPSTCNFVVRVDGKLLICNFSNACVSPRQLLLRLPYTCVTGLNCNADMSPTHHEDTTN